eukprot:14282630-Alexandrium_andersonii.AAC.1
MSTHLKRPLLPSSHKGQEAAETCFHPGVQRRPLRPPEQRCDRHLARDGRRIPCVLAAWGPPTPHALA